MEFLNNSKNHSLNRKTYLNLRWIGIIGQFITINSVAFIFKFEFNFILANIVVLIGTLSNILLIYFFKKNQLEEKISFIFLIIDILQLSFLLYLTGGTINPFSIFLIIPSIFAANSLSIKTNILLILFTISSIILITFMHQELPSPLDQYTFNNYYYYSVPLALIVALIFLSFFAITFGQESSLRKEALNKIQQLIAKEHELVSLGGQAAAAAHSLATPLSTIKLISQELSKSLKGNKDIEKDILLLTQQVERCNQILKKLTLNPDIDDDFIHYDLTLSNYINEIIKSFQNISKKKFFFQITVQKHGGKWKNQLVKIQYKYQYYLGLEAIINNILLFNTN